MIGLEWNTSPLLGSRGAVEWISKAWPTRLDIPCCSASRTTLTAGWCGCVNDRRTEQMTRLRQLPPLVRPVDTRTVRPPPRQPEPHYQTAAHVAWACEVVQRAGGRCEHVDRNGNRCTKAAPLHRMFADHRIEVRDGGALLDLTNGQCLCGAHHTRKTIEARAKRLK